MIQTIIRKYNEEDISSMISIWNEVVDEGIAFPQENCLTEQSGKDFAEQSYCGVAVEKDTDEIKGMYILHPNNVGRCGHICNASYAVASHARGLHIGEQLVLDCMKQAKQLDFQILQFNAVVATNMHARTFI